MPGILLGKHDQRGQGCCQNAGWLLVLGELSLQLHGRALLTVQG